MADVEVQLDVKAEYKQALMAIAALGKALDAVQQRAQNLLVNFNNLTPQQQQNINIVFNTADVQAFKDELLKVSQALVDVTNNTTAYGQEWQKNGITPQQVKDVADLSNNYLLLANAINQVVAGMNNLGGANPGGAPGNLPQLQVLQQQIQLLQQQIQQLQQQIQQIQQQTPPPGTPPGTPPNNPNNPNNPQNIQRILWLQQAQAARNLARSVQALSEDFSNLEESIKNGTLNLLNLATTVIQLGRVFRASLGPIGLAILAIEGLTAAWNTYAKISKRTADAEKNVQATMRMTKDAFDAAAVAKSNYLKEEQRKNEIVELKGQYSELNDELERGLTLIQETTRAEISRLALTEDEAQHAMTLKKAELGRQFASGLITQEEYETSLIELSKQEKIRKAKGNVSRAKLKTQETGSRLEAERTAYNEKERIFSQIEYELGQYMSDEEIEVLMSRRADMQKKYDEISAALAKVQKQEKEAIWGGFGGLKSLELANEREALTQELEAISEGLQEFNSFINQKTGNVSLKDYKANRKQAQERFNIAKGQRDSAGKKLETAAKADEQARRALEDVRRESRQEVRQAQEFADSERETRRVRKEAEERRKREREEEQRRKEQEREAQRRAKLQSDAIAEGEYEGNLTKQARAIAKGKGYKMLADNKLSKNELAYLIKVAQQNSENEALIALIKDIIATALKNNMTTATAIKHQRAELNKLNINVLD